MKITALDGGSLPKLGATGIGGATAVPDASDIPIAGGYYGAGTVEEALAAIAAELAELAGTGETRYWPMLALTSAPIAATGAHVSDTTDAHDASAISVLDTAGKLASADVEGALAELAARDQVSRDAATAAAADHVARIRLGTDTTYRADLGLDASDRGALEFGPGGTAARDTRLLRVAAGVLQVDSNGLANSARLALRAEAGQRAYLDAAVIGDTQVRLLIGGDAALAGFALGPGNAGLDVQVFRGDVNRLDLASGDSLNLVLGNLLVAATNVVGTRKTGWAAPTGTATRTTFATDTVTLIELARRVKALIDDLTTHGLIGP